jgi:hypothetical protein
MFEFQFDTGNNSNTHYIDLYEITGYNIDNAIIEIAGLDDYTYNESIGAEYRCDNGWDDNFFMFDGSGLYTWGKYHIYTAEQNCRIVETVVSNSSKIFYSP